MSRGLGILEKLQHVTRLRTAKVVRRFLVAMNDEALPIEAIIMNGFSETRAVTLAMRCNLRQSNALVREFTATNFHKFVASA
jgi:hypothetical protein